MFRRICAYLLTLIMVFGILPSEVFAITALGGAFGDGKNTSGKTSKGTVSFVDDVAIRVSVRFDTDEGWRVGYENIYPANPTYSIIVGSKEGSAASKVRKLFYPKDGTNLKRLGDVPNMYTNFSGDKWKYFP